MASECPRSTDRSNTVPVTVVVHRMSPAGGLEHAVADLIVGYGPSHVDLVVLHGPVASSLGGKLDDCRVHTGRRAALEALAALRSDSPVVVAGLWAASHCAAALGIRRRFSNVVYWEHSLLPHRLEIDARLRLVTRLARPFVRRCGRVVAVSEGVRAGIEEITERSDVQVIPNLVDLVVDRRHDANSPHDTLRLATVGTLRAVKNTELAIRAMGHLDAAQLAVVGDGPLMSELTRLARDLGVDDRVQFHGRVDDVASIVGASDVLVHPSRSETFGLAVLEAAVLDVPVVTLDVAALDEMVPRYAVGVRSRADDPAGFAEAVRSADALRTRADLFEQARQNRARDLSPDVTLASWRVLLQGALT